jgi:hypothetical protein
MLANFLNKSKPINFIGLLIFFFFGFIFSIFNDGFSVDILIKSTALLLLFLVVFFIYNFINSKNRLTLDNSYAYFLFTILILSILSEFTNYKILIQAAIYLLFLRKLYSLRSANKILQKLFDSGFWLGVFFTLEPFSISLFILIYIASYLHNKITIHTLLVPIIGFTTPLLLYFAYFFWFDNVEEFTNLFNFEVIFDIQFYSETKYFWMILSVLFFTICAIFFKSIKALSVNNTFKKSWILLIANFSIILLFLLFLPQKNGPELIFILFPVSVILANGIELIKKKVLKNAVLYFLLISSIIVHYFL